MTRRVLFFPRKPGSVSPARRLSTARGLMIGFAISAAIWATILALVFLR